MSYIAFRIANVSVSYVDDYLKSISQPQIMTNYSFGMIKSYPLVMKSVSCKGKKNVLFKKFSYQACFKSNFMLS